MYHALKPDLVNAAPAKNRRGLLITWLITLGAFGPYLVSGFRTEQVIVYGLAALIASTAVWTRIRPTGTAVVVTVLLAAQLAMAVITTIWPPLNTTKYQQGSVLGGVDNLALPLAVAFIVWCLLTAGADRLVLTRTVCVITVWLMVINAGLEVWATGGDGPNLDAFHGLTDGYSVSELAAQLGRFSGIFNQPAEAGLMYSVALIAAVYLYKERAALLAVTATCLTIGGVLTVSKTFLLVGFPIGVWHVLRSSGGRRRRYAAVVAVGMAAWAGAKSGLTPEWKGEKFLLHLMPGSDQGAVDQYTAGRLGEGSTLAYVVDAVLNSEPIAGFGAAGLTVAYDNGWVEQLVMNGVVGVVLHTAVLILLVVAWAFHKRNPGDLRRLSGGLVAAIIGANVGLPALTANRCATVVWLLLALLLFDCETRTGGDATSTELITR